MDYESLCSLTNKELASRDLAFLNLTCAVGLSPTPDINITASCQQVDDWTELVAKKVKSSLRRWSSGQYAEFTGNQFRVMVMITVLQRDLHLGYNLAFSSGDYNARDAGNLFIHGLLQGHGGTCVSMPMLYVAIGRRLGWPLKIVLAKEHVFCRWDDESGEKFNIEATARGFVSHSNERYTHLPLPLTKSELASGMFLRNLTPREELSFSICQRGHCLLDNFRFAEAIQAYGYANKLAPHDPATHNHWGLATIIHRIYPVVQWYKAHSRPGKRCLIPPPQDAWEERFYPDAIKCLRRILRLRTVANEIKDSVTKSASISKT
jgi:regulator of sirC expression with transglutaminase-like and TPR domain